MKKYRKLCVNLKFKRFFLNYIICCVFIAKLIFIKNKSHTHFTHIYVGREAEKNRRVSEKVWESDRVAKRWSAI